MIDRREVVGWLEVARSFVVVACLLAALLGFAAAVLSGVHVATLLLVPIAMLVAALSSPMTLMLLVVGVLALHGLVLASATVIAALRRPAADLSLEEVDRTEAAEARLRRHYAAGIIGAARFRDGMLSLLRERYARGDLSLGEYEGAVDRLMRPAEAASN